MNATDRAGVRSSGSPATKLRFSRCSHSGERAGRWRVGEAGFEPATTSTQSLCTTGLCDSPETSELLARQVREQVRISLDGPISPTAAPH